MPRGIENHSKLSLEGSGRFEGGFGALDFMNAERRANKDEKWSHFDATWSIWCAILAPTGIRTAETLGISRYIFGATANTRKNVYVLTAVPLNLETAKQQ